MRDLLEQDLTRLRQLVKQAETQFIGLQAQLVYVAGLLKRMDSPPPAATEEPPQ